MIADVRNAALRGCFNTVHWLAAMRVLNAGDNGDSGDRFEFIYSRGIADTTIHKDTV